MLRMRETMRWTIPILPLVVALGLSVTGCATIRAHQTAETEQVLAAAGFQVEPDTPEKLAHLQTLTPRKVVRDVRDGQPQYVYADPQTCKCLYVGDEKRYQRYQELNLQKQIADEQLSAAQYWGGWPGPWGW